MAINQNAPANDGLQERSNFIAIDHSMRPGLRSAASSAAIHHEFIEHILINFYGLFGRL